MTHSGEALSYSVTPITGLPAGLSTSWSRSHVDLERNPVDLDCAKGARHPVDRRAAVRTDPPIAGSAARSSDGPDFCRPTAPPARRESEWRYAISDGIGRSLSSCSLFVLTTSGGSRVQISSRAITFAEAVEPLGKIRRSWPPTKRDMSNALRPDLHDCRPNGSTRSPKSSPPA